MMAVFLILHYSSNRPIFPDSISDRSKYIHRQVIPNYYSKINQSMGRFFNMLCAIGHELHQLCQNIGNFPLVMAAVIIIQRERI